MRKSHAAPIRVAPLLSGRLSIPPSGHDGQGIDICTQVYIHPCENYILHKLPRPDTPAIFIYMSIYLCDAAYFFQVVYLFYVIYVILLYM